jgi:hypothetical protein
MSAIADAAIYVENASSVTAAILQVGRGQSSG